MATAALRPPPMPQRPLTTGLSLWWLLPLPLRSQLRTRVPLDARVIDDTAALVVQVGPPIPLRWLLLSADDAGRIQCRLWAVERTRVSDLAAATVAADEVVRLLQKWAAEFLR